MSFSLRHRILRVVQLVTWKRATLALWPHRDAFAGQAAPKQSNLSLKELFLFLRVKFPFMSIEEARTSHGPATGSAFESTMAWFVALNRPEPRRWDDIHREDRRRDTLARPLREVLRHHRQLAASTGRQLFSAVYSHFLSRASEKSFALARATLEWARQRSLEHGDRDALEETSRILTHPELEAETPGPISELLILLEAYRADDRRYDGDPLGAESVFESLRPRLRETSSEIRAMVFELESDLASHNGDIEGALVALDRAEGLLAGIEMPGRRTSLFLRRGRLMLKSNRKDAARAAFEAARRSGPLDVDGRQRLEAGHCLVAIHLANRSPREAEKLMDEIRSSYAMWSGDRNLEAERLGLQGRILLHREKPDEAVLRFDRAFDLFLELGRLRNAFRTFDDLLEAIVVAQRLERAGKSLEKRLRRLLEAPGLSELAYVEVLRHLDKAEKLGLELPPLRHLAAQLLPSPYAAN